MDVDQYLLLKRAAARRKTTLGGLIKSFINWRDVKKMALCQPLEDEVDPAAA
jgi:hypothetical protein